MRSGSPRGATPALLSLLALCTLASASAAPSLPAAFHQLSPAVLPAPPPDRTNRHADDPAAARLGAQLFSDPGFSGALLEGDNDGGGHALGKRGETGKVSCAGCHVPAAGFLDDRSLGQQVSLAAGWTPRRAPSLLDVAQSRLLHWDGAHDSTWSQVFGPLEHDNEMNSARLFVAEEVFRRYRAAYQSIFGPLPPLDDASRFPQLAAVQAGCQKRMRAQNDPRGPGIEEVCHGLPGDHAEFDQLTISDQEAVTRVVVNFGKAIGAYLRTLTCGQSRFDEWVHGRADALTPEEQRGAYLFIGKAKCVQCHSGPYLSDEQFHNVGLLPRTVAVVINDNGDTGAAAGLSLLRADPLNSKGVYSDGDDGRVPGQIPPAMLGAFRTPKLRCVSMRPSFMHTGQLRRLEDVIAFFAEGGHPFGYPGKNELNKLTLSVEERKDLVEFLRGLQGSLPATSRSSRGSKP